MERADGEAIVLDISGRLVLHEGDGPLKDKVGTLLKQGSRQILLNLGDVQFVDSAGLGAIVGVCLAAKKQGGVVRLLNPSKRLQELLTMAKLQSVVDIYRPDAPA